MRISSFLQLLVLCLASGASLRAQSVESYLHAAGDHAALYQGCIEPTSTYARWHAQPYWWGTEYREGSLCYDGLTYRNVGMHYDAYSQQLAVSSPERKVPVLPEQERIAWFELDGQRYVRLGDRFYRVDYAGQRVSLLFNRSARRIADYISDGHAYRDFTFDDQHYLLEPDGTLVTVSKVRRLASLYPQYKKQLRNYGRTHQELADGVHYLDNLLLGDGVAEGLGTALVQGRETALHPLANNPVTVVLAPDSIRPASYDRELPSYEAYRTGGHAEYDQYEEFVSGENPGIAELDPVKEKRYLEEVMVTGYQQKVGMVQMGMEKFRPGQLRNIPLALGEADVMKMLQTLPGIKTMGEASSGFNVRGGASEQNLILLNGNTVYNPMHLFGLFSAFNSDVIGETELYKSSIPAQYGGRISSVMNIESRVIDKQELHGSASLGLLTSKATLELPLVKDHASLLLGGRMTYSDWMLGMIPEKSGYRDGSAGFWDLSGTLDVRLNARHRLSIYGYGSHDRFAFTSYDKYGYTNLNGAAEWRGRYADGLTSTVSIGMDHYDYTSDDTEVPYSAARLSFAINQYFLRARIEKPLNERHKLQAGMESLFYDLQPGSYEPLGDESYIAYNRLDRDRALETSLYAEDQWEALPRLTVDGGLRYTLYNAMREGKTKVYQAPELRLSLVYMLADDQSLKLGFNTMHQYIHKVSNTSIMSPTDTWTLSNARIHPQSGWQLAGGYYYQTHDSKYEVTVEAYYKQMSNYLTYRSAGQLLMNPDLEEDVIATRGRAWGVELQLRKPLGKLNGWIAYSYSRTELRQKNLSEGSPINGGAWFPADFDRPHEVKLVANYKFTQRYSLSVNGEYSTGRPTTVPMGQYYNYAQRRVMPFYTDRNSYRMPDYMRVDASFNIEPSHHLTLLTHSWLSLGVYNLFGRKNAYSIYYLSEGQKIQGYKLSIFGAPIPFVSYNIKF